MDAVGAEVGAEDGANEKRLPIGFVPAGMLSGGVSVEGVTEFPID